MHHVVLERWSRGASWLHCSDARAKIVILLVFLVCVATTPPRAAPLMMIYVVLPISAVRLARLPLLGVLLRACAVLPFVVVFALISFIYGDVQHGVALLEKSYLSALAVLVVAGTTPVSHLLRGLESLAVPRFPLLVVHFLYRYLFVVSEQAQHMRLAAASRGSGGGGRFRKWRLSAAAGALAVLFARSYRRAEGTYWAMLSRSFDGRIRLLTQSRLTADDILLAVLGVLAPLGLRFAMVLSY